MGSPARILIVDDEPHVRAMVAATLERLNHRTAQAADLSSAFDQIERHQFDLVLTDMVMRDGNGMTLLERLRFDHPQTPVVMVTAIQDVSVAISAMRNGAFDYLLKPFEREQLLTAVNRALGHRKTLRENESYQQNLEQIVQARTELLHQAILDLERSYDITLEALGDALDLKDTETEGHSRRVTAYTIALARAMQLPPQEIRTMARGAFLHDVGKMAIPDAILLKPGRLTLDEQSTMREHCERGYQMLRKIPYLREAAEIVYSHQEHFNGRGYPRGLKGEEIPLGARIFAVADALDAITSDRPYRSGTSFASARKEIRKNMGTQFDPQVVDVFLSMPDRVWEDLRAEIQGEAQKFNPFSLGAVKHLLPRKDGRGPKNGIQKSMPETKNSAALDA